MADADKTPEVEVLPPLNPNQDKANLKATQKATAPKAEVSDEVKADYEVKAELEDGKPVEVDTRDIKPKGEVDMANPKEGDTYIDERGDTNVFKNGTWIVFVHNSAATF